ncbi:TetR/AcrR family transcriptional regulator [Gluconacetobacter sp. Hr-1-5]|uniref:TetR/AcrR family transcriptional regulator n=1 Tax=Gluconacetobacter sp. Hr-1-5 TaxID=3395370 RepID=UPI003B52A08F
MTDDSATPDRAGRREALADAAADLVLREGLGTMGLRGLARRLGTSDRMLIYYFGSKDALVAGVLARIGEKLSVLLQAYSAGPPVSPGAFLGQVLALGRDPVVMPFMRVWTDVIARAAAGEAPYDMVAKAVVADWTAWIGTRLIPDPNRSCPPAALLSIVEGVTLLEMACPGSTAAAGPYLAEALARADGGTG